jgi:hypothetical protein
MHTLRTSKLIAQLVLVWFALFVGAAIASPYLQTDGLQAVCASGGGVKLVSASGEEGNGPAPVGMDCPLCASASPLLSLVGLNFEPPSQLAHALQPAVVARLASATAPPLPSRGPPTLI